MRERRSRIALRSTPAGEPANALFCGDNLDILRQIDGESIDLIYLDPPFNSNASYSAISGEPASGPGPARIAAFEDAWQWDAQAQDAFGQVMKAGNAGTAAMLRATRSVLHESDMLAYLAMMAVRLMEMNRILKPTGTLYLHCDPTASHYLKILMDAIFGTASYRNEIIWKRSNPKSHVSTNFPTCTDTILRYCKGPEALYRQPYAAHDPDYVARAYRYRDHRGVYRLLPLLNPNHDRPNLTYAFLGVTRVWRWTRERMQKAYDDGLVVQLKPGAVPQYKKYLSDSKGRTVTNCWTDVPQVAGSESSGYPTQKPLALLERIIAASSDEGDVVLDPFCGSGTTLHAAQKLKRRWIGIDRAPVAVETVKRRFAKAFPEAEFDVRVVLPEDVPALARKTPDHAAQQGSSPPRVGGRQAAKRPGGGRAAVSPLQGCGSAPRHGDATLDRQSGLPPAGEGKEIP